MLGATGVRRSDGVSSLLADIASALDHRNKRDEESAAGKKGTLQSISKEDELKVHAARGCGQFTVALGAEELGRQLCKALLKAAEHSSALFKYHKFPTVMSCRLAYGIAMGSWGGRSNKSMASWSLSTADFPTSTEEAFDLFVPSADFKVEGRPRAPHGVLTWARQARNGIRVFSLVYGKEHEAERTKALEYLVELHEAGPRKYPLDFIQGSWEELHSRWWEELSWAVASLRKLIGKEQVRKEEFSFAAMAPDPAGQTNLKLPDTFMVQSPTLIEARLLRQAAKTYWEAAHRSTRPPKAGENEEPSKPEGDGTKGGVRRAPGGRGAAVRRHASPPQSLVQPAQARRGVSSLRQRSPCQFSMHRWIRRGNQSAGTQHVTSDAPRLLRPVPSRMPKGFVTPPGCIGR